MGETGAKKTLERTGAVLSAVGGLIAIIVAATQQRPASAIAITAAVLLLVGWALFWVLRAKTALGESRFPRGRWVATGIAALTIVGVGIAFIVPGSRTFVNHDVLGFTSVRNDIRIAQVLVAESDTAYRISIVARNDTAREELASKVTLTTTCGPPLPASPPNIYQIQQSFRVGVASGQAQVLGQVATAQEPTFHSQVSGKLVRGACGDTEISLSFDLSAALPANQHTAIVVDLPKTLSAPDPTPKPVLKGAPTPPSSTVTLPVPRPNAKNFVATVTISGVALSGSPAD